MNNTNPNKKTFYMLRCRGDDTFLTKEGTRTSVNVEEALKEGAATSRTVPGMLTSQPTVGLCDELVRVEQTTKEGGLTLEQPCPEAKPLGYVMRMEGVRSFVAFDAEHRWELDGSLNAAAVFATVEDALTQTQTQTQDYYFETGKLVGKGERSRGKGWGGVLDIRLLPVFKAPARYSFTVTPVA